MAVKKVLGRGQFSPSGVETFGKQRQCTVLSKSKNGLYYTIRWDGNAEKTKMRYSVDFIELIPDIAVLDTDLEKLKQCYTELGVDFHEVKIEQGYTYIRKMYSHEEKGYINVFGYGLVKLEKPEQLREFFEFNEKGKLVSW